MKQDTHLYIEANQKHGHGYQVRIVIDGIVDTTMADEPFSLYDALGGAQLTLEAVNKERGTNYLLPDVLLVSREAAGAERRTDFLSAKLLQDILTLEHENGVQTQYAHLSEFLVNAGAEVRQGQIIAKTGDSGWTTGPHLHLGVLIDGEAVDPLETLKSE